MNFKSKALYGAASAAALLMAAGAVQAQTLAGTTTGVTASSTVLGTSSTSTTGDSSVAPFTNVTTTVQNQVVTTSIPSTTVTPTVTVGGTVYTSSQTVAGAGTQAQTSTTTLTNTYAAGPPPVLLTSTPGGPTVANVGAATVTSVSASGFAGGASATGQMSYGATLSTSGAVTAGSVVATEKDVVVTTSGETYSTYTGTATYNPATGGVIVALPTLASQTSITSSGLTTTGSVSAATLSATSVTATTIAATGGISGKTLTANVGGTAGAAAIDAGGGRIVNVAAGTSGTDAVNLTQMNAALTALGNSWSVTLNSNKKRADAGTAVAVALSGGMFLPDHKVNLTGNVGTYEGETAAALQLGILVSPSVAFNAGVATAFKSYGGTAGRAGFTVGF